MVIAFWNQRQYLISKNATLGWYSVMFAPVNSLVHTIFLRLEGKKTWFVCGVCVTVDGWHLGWERYNCHGVGFLLSYEKKKHQKPMG